MEGEECYKHCRCSKINLVDLAGSERLSHSCTTGDRLRVSKFIGSETEMKTSSSSVSDGIIAYRKEMRSSLCCFLVLHFLPQGHHY